MRFVCALRLRVSAFQGKPWPIVEEKNKLRNQQKKNQEEQAKEKADWNCEKSGNFKSFITNCNVVCGKIPKPGDKIHSFSVCPAGERYRCEVQGPGKP